METSVHPEKADELNLLSQYRHILSELDRMTVDIIAAIEDEIPKKDVIPSLTTIARQLDDLAFSIRTWAVDLTLSDTHSESGLESLGTEDSMRVLETCRDPILADMHRLFNQMKRASNIISTELTSLRKNTHQPVVGNEGSEILQAALNEFHLSLDALSNMKPRIRRILGEVSVDEKRAALNDGYKYTLRTSVLTLDGGGVRSYSSIMIITALMDQVRVALKADGRDTDVRPADIFEYIFGSSSGGLFAIMLGRLGMAEKQSQDAFERFASDLFGHPTFSSQLTFGLLGAKYSGKRLDRAIRHVIGHFDPSPEGLKWRRNLFSFPSGRCKVAVIAWGADTIPRLFRTYDTKPQDSDFQPRNPGPAASCQIWEAARATTAAPTYFPPITVDGVKYFDGGLGTNNPTAEAYRELVALGCTKSRPLPIIVSIGTGIRRRHPGSSGFNSMSSRASLIKYAINDLTDTTRVHNELSALSRDDNIAYFRFNVDAGLEDINLDTWRTPETRRKIQDSTAAYITQPETQERLRQCARELIRFQDQSQNYSVPFNLTGMPTSEGFVGRSCYTESLIEYFTTPSIEKRPQSRRKVYVLHGLGGVGKTQLCVQFVRSFQQFFSAVAWLDGTSTSSLEASLLRFSARTSSTASSSANVSTGSTDAKIKIIMEWLSRPDNNGWLIVFDGVDQDYQASNDGDGEAYDVTRYFPAADHGSILITTRLRNLELLGNSMKVGPLDVYESRLLLESKVRRSLSGDVDSHKTIMELGGLPLALASAGSYVRESCISFKEYNELLETARQEVAAAEDKYPLRDYGYRKLQTTWLISYEAIKAQDERAATLLKLWAFLARDKISWEFFGNTHTVPAIWLGNLPMARALRSTFESHSSFLEVIRLLLRHSFIDRNEADYRYSMHTIVHEWIYTFARNENKEATKHLLALSGQIIAGQVPSEEGMFSFWTVQRSLLAHADVFCHRLKQEAAEFRDTAVLLDAWEWHNLGFLMASMDRFKEGEKMYTYALQSKLNTLGPDNESTLDTVVSLADLHREQGKLLEAETMYHWALAGNEKALAPDHTLTLQTISNLGLLYNNQGKLAEAEAMYQRALVGYKKALTPNHPSTLQTINNLGLLYRDQGKLAEAEEMCQRALSGREKALGQEHMSTLQTVNNIGLLYRDQGKLAEAELMYQRALAGNEKALGLDHTLTLHTVNNLGLLYSDQARLAEAEAMYQRALAGYEKALGLDHTSTLDTVKNLGNLYRDQGKLNEAEEMFQRALASYEKALGTDHTSTLSTVNNLGILYGDQGKLEEAEKMYQRALAGYEKALGPDHTSTLSTVNNLGNLYGDQGKLAEAEQMYQRALAGYEKALGPDHTSTLMTANNLGILYRDQGKLAEAEQMYQRALAGYEKALGPDHTSTLDTINNLGILYRDQGKLAEAEEMYQRALAGTEKALGPDHTSTLNKVNNLGNLYSDQGKLAEAEQMFQRALAGYEKALGPDYTSTLSTVNNLGNLYGDQGRLAGAEETYQRARMLLRISKSL